MVPLCVPCSSQKVFFPWRLVAANVIASCTRTPLSSMHCYWKVTLTFEQMFSLSGHCWVHVHGLFVKRMGERVYFLILVDNGGFFFLFINMCIKWDTVLFPFDVNNIIIIIVNCIKKEKRFDKYRSFGLVLSVNFLSALQKVWNRFFHQLFSGN